KKGGSAIDKLHKRHCFSPNVKVLVTFYLHKLPFPLGGSRYPVPGARISSIHPPACPHASEPPPRRVSDRHLRCRRYFDPVGSCAFRRSSARARCRFRR